MARCLALDFEYAMHISNGCPSRPTARSKQRPIRKKLLPCSVTQRPVKCFFTSTECRNRVYGRYFRRSPATYVVSQRPRAVTVRIGNDDVADFFRNTKARQGRQGDLKVDKQ